MKIFIGFMQLHCKEKCSKTAVKVMSELREINIGTRPFLLSNAQATIFTNPDYFYWMNCLIVKTIRDRILYSKRSSINKRSSRRSSKGLHKVYLESICDLYSKYYDLLIRQRLQCRNSYIIQLIQNHPNKI